ncbi:hypothetical protein BH11BAC3_BH11BAC3_10330 [soil metagenome]
MLKRKETILQLSASISGLGDWTVFENLQPVTELKFINKSSLFILFLIVNRLLELKLISEQKVENIRRPAILPSLVIYIS